MRQLAIAICDENSKDTKILEEYIKRLLLDVEITKFTDPQQLLKCIIKNPDQFDLIFMEIIFSEDNGIRIAQRIRKVNKTITIIFTTKSEKYYRQAFDVFARQYLLKPISIKNIREIFDVLESDIRENAKNMDEDRVVCFRYRSQFYTIKHSNIEYISSSLHTVNFHLEDGNVIHCRGKLNDFEEQLKDSLFLRCHQSFFVNLSKTIGMRADGFIMRDMDVPISRTYLKEMQRRYQDYLNEKSMFME